MKTLNACLLWSITAVFLAACDSRDSFDSWYDRDYLINEGEFSVTVTREKGVQVSGWMEHGSGYTAKERNDYWRVAWMTSNLIEDGENFPSATVHLGRYEAKRERGQSHPVLESGIDMETSDFTRNDRVLVWKNGEYLAPRVPVVGQVAIEGRHKNDRPQLNSLTTSKQHLLVWEQPLVICATSNLEVRREIKESFAVAKLRRLHDTAVGIHYVGLTNDLRYIVVVPHNGNDAPQGGNHHRVWGYDLVEDRFFERSFARALGDTAVASVQSWQGKPYYFVYSPDERELGLFDDEKNLVTQIPSDQTRPHNFEANLFWQPDRKTIWIAKGEINLDQCERRIELRRFNYAEKSSTDYVLNTGPLKAP